MVKGKISTCVREFNRLSCDNSGTLPYHHLVNMATLLLRPLFFGYLAKTAVHFLVKKTLFNMAIFFQGFQCNYT